MKKEFEKILMLINQDYIVNDYLAVKEHNGKLKLFYYDKVVTISSCGFAYLLLWYCDGSITSTVAKHFNDIVRSYNDEY